MKYTKKKNVCARACVCACVCACARACARVCFFHTTDESAAFVSEVCESAAFVSQLDTVGGVRARRHRLESAPFSQALVRRYCSLRPGSGCRLRSEERDATEEHEFSHIVLSAARPAASAATAVPSCSESTILPAAFGIVVSLHICERTRHDASTPPTGPLANKRQALSTMFQRNPSAHTSNSSNSKSHQNCAARTRTHLNPFLRGKLNRAMPQIG